MNKKRGCRPWYKAVPYTESNWQIIGREAYVAEKMLEDGETYSASALKQRPRQTGPIIAAKFYGSCRYCHCIIDIGNQICRAEFEDGSESWVHNKCAQ